MNVNETKMPKLPELPISLLGMRVLNLLKLNVLWLLCCLPVVTIGPATSAMNYVVNLYLEEKSDEVARPFFRAFRRDLGQGILLGLFLLLLTVLAVFDGLFLFANFSQGFHLAWIPFVFLALFLVSLYVYAFPTLSRYALRFTELLKNSVLLFWQNLWTSVGAVLVLCAPFLLMWVFPDAATEILFLWVLIGGSLSAYINNKGILKILDREQRRLECSSTP